MTESPHEAAGADDLWGEDEPSGPPGAYDPVADTAELGKVVRQRQRYRYAEDVVARQRLEEQWRPIDEQGSLDHQLSQVDTTPLYLVDGIFPANTICQLNAQFKCGKTTLVTNLVHCLAERGPFLGQFGIHPGFKGNVAHWNLEVSQTTLLSWYRKQAMAPEALGRVFPLSVRGNLRLDFSNEMAVEWTIKWLQNNNIKVWIVDPLSKLFREDENNNLELNRWWLKLEHIMAEARVKLVLLVHHTGHSNQRARGASAMMGNPDVLLNYTHAGNLGDVPPSTVRFLEAFGRDVDLAATEIDYRADTNTLFCTGSGRTRSAARTDDLARKAGVAVWSADQRLKTGDLYAQLGWKPSGPKSRDYTAAILQAVREDFIKQATEGRTKWHSPGSVDPRTDTERSSGGSPSTPGASDA